MATAKKTAKKRPSVRDLARKLREAYRAATWDVRGLASNALEAEEMTWDEVARVALREIHS